MKLEDQGLDDSQQDARIEEYMRDVIKDRDLWAHGD
jgi:hypothetical protein